MSTEKLGTVTLYCSQEMSVYCKCVQYFYLDKVLMEKLPVKEPQLGRKVRKAFK